MMSKTSPSTSHRLTVSSIGGVKARRGSSLSFHDLNVTVQDSEKQILYSVAGSVEPGEMLAIMGPSGAGKTTLLNVLAGRLRSGYSQTGQVLIDGESLNKHLKRKVSYVLQEDVFFSFLTLKQTLTYSALLRLPSSMTKQAKLRMVDHAIQVLGVENCQNTIFGSAFYSGLSGGKLVGLALIIFVILIKGGICSTFYF
jgi:ABC-type multidrug transport system ATPase subunit